MVSLDDEKSRKWIFKLKPGDERRGDLIGIRQSNDGPIIDVIEVKSNQNSADAKKQIDSTIAKLKLIFDVSNINNLNAARKEILRDQLYKSLSSQSSSVAKMTEKLVNMLNDLFKNGPTSGYYGYAVLVKIQPNLINENLVEEITRDIKTNEGNIIDIVKLIASENLINDNEFTDYQNNEINKELKDNENIIEEDKETKDQKDENIFGVKTEEIKESTKIVEEKMPDALVDSARVYIGNSISGDDKIEWYPKKPNQKLENFGILVTGDSGNGKTETLKVFIKELSKNYPVCIFNFKADYNQNEFVQSSNLKVYDLDEKGLPFNPLEIIFRGDGYARPVNEIYALRDILKRVYKTIGAQQLAALTSAMKLAYENCGIDLTGRVKKEDIQNYPVFSDVQNILQSDADNTNLLNYLTPLFDLGLFPTSSEDSISFRELINDKVVLDFTNIENDEVKQTIAEMIILRLHKLILTGEQPRKLTRLLVFDEAWRVSGSKSLEELGREGRAFGIGLAIGTQFPGDIPDTIRGSLASKILFKNSEHQHVQSALRTIIGQTSGSEANQVSNILRSLKVGQALITNNHYHPYKLVNVKPFNQRD